MAISKDTVWGTGFGADNNGGGYVCGSSGVDYSWQPAPQLAVTDGVANGTTTLTTATGGATAALVGNLVCLEGGNPVLGRTRVYIVSVTNANTIVVDATVPAGTGITMRVGGALLGYGELSFPTPRGVAPSNLVWCYGSIPISVGFTSAAMVVSPNNTALPTRLRGCGATRGDGGMATIQPAAGMANLVNLSGQGWEFSNFIFDGLNLVTGNLLNLASGNYDVYNCTVRNGLVGGISVVGGNCRIYNNEITKCTVGLAMAGGCCAIGNNIHENSSHGITATGVMGIITHNHIWGNGGDAINSAQTAYIDDNNCYGNGGNGVNVLYSQQRGTFVINNIFDSNVGTGLIACSGAGFPFTPFYDGNSYHGNGGIMTNIGDTGTVNPINSKDFSAFSHNQNPTTPPYNNAAIHDFGLNAIATGGGLLRAVGMPRNWPNLPMANNVDLGPTQHPDPTPSGGGGGGGNIIYV